MSIELIGIIILSVVLGVVLAAYERLIRKLDKYQREQEIIDAQSKQRAAKIVEAAKEKALAILENTKIDAKESQEDIDKKLEQITNKQMDYYKELLQSISENIKDDAKKVLEQQATGAQNTVIQKIEDDYSEAKKQVEAYKQEQMKQIDARSGEIIKEFTRLALGKAMPEELKQALVMEALEEAKKTYAA